MNPALKTLVEEYLAAMRDYIQGHGEAALERAYEAGRRALSQGLGVLEMAALYQNSVSQLLAEGAHSAGQEQALLRAFVCFAESLSPFEMVVRGTQEANAQLQQSLIALQTVEEQLRRQNEELKAAHAAALKERGRYQALFHFAPDGYLVTGLEGAIQEANAAAAAILQTEKELLPGQSLSEFVVPADREAFRERLHALHQGVVERVGNWEIEIQTRAGPPVPVEFTVVAETVVPTIATLRWLIRDVQERKRQERERARWMVARAKAQAARRFEFLARASSLLVGSLNVEANLVSVGQLAAEHLDGWCFVSIAEPDGRLRQLDVAHADPTDTDLTRELRRHCLFGAPEDRGLLETPSLVEPLTGEWCDRAADSPRHAGLLRRLCGCSCMVLRLHARNRVLGMLVLVSAFRRRFSSAERVMAEDLARRCSLALENARLYQDVVAERDRAEQASRAKDEFVAILGHELRNPLTPILGWTRILKNHADLQRSPELAGSVEAIEKNARMLTRLVDDCLDLTRVSVGKIQIERKAVDLNQIVKVSAEAIAQAAAAKGLKVSRELAPAPIIVLGDAVRLEQVLMNLLLNAVRYSDPGGSIAVRISAAEGETEIEVRDTGVGIDREFLEQIFEPFRQGTNSWLRSRSGLGLGLAIARRILERHGGGIRAESQGLGYGSTFRMWLPVAQAEEAELPIQAPPPGETPEPGIRILLVEDAPDILRLMKIELEKRGHTVVTAVDGQKGIEAARTHRPDLIVSDIKMPIVDGYELMRMVRDEPELRATPAIALTGFGAKRDVERTRAAGFDVCLTKPAEPEELALLIRELMQRKALQGVPQRGEIRTEAVE